MATASDDGRSPCATPAALSDATLKQTSSEDLNEKRKEINDQDVDERVDTELATRPSRGSSHHGDAGLPYLVQTQSSGQRVVQFGDNDPGDPYNWSNFKKCYVVFVSIMTVLNSTVGSSLSSNSASFVGTYFNIDSTYLLILPTSMYLVGYVVGPIAWGPLSEQYGRKYTMLAAFFLYTIWTMAVALAPNFPALVVFRLFTGLAAAAPIAIVGGTCADIFANPETRGRAMAIFMSSTVFGPCAGPIVSGFISPVSWRWSYWVGLIFAGVSWIPLLLVPETFGPVILAKRAKAIRKARQNPGDENVHAAIELESQDWRHFFQVVLTRPIRMFCFEALVLFTCLYCAFAYAIFYMFLVAFPIIYQGVYGFNYGEVGLAFLGIAIGAFIACGIYLAYDNILRKAKARNAKWSRSEESRRLPLACAAGPFFVVSCFWLGWTARPEIHWIVPMLSGIPFGVGYLLLFMALLNYLVDAYKIFAASAMAASSTTRSLFGAVLPLATESMFGTLGIAWACSLLGFLSILLSIIPFVFIWKGDKIRARSEFCQYLAKKEEEETAKKARMEERRREKEGRRSDEKEVV